MDLALVAWQALAGSRRRSAARWMEQPEGAAPQARVSLSLRRPAPEQVPGQLLELAMEQARWGVRQVWVALWALWALSPGNSRSRR
jgi:hypothetical protein